MRKEVFDLVTTPITFPDHYTLTVSSQSNDGAHTWRNSIDIVQTHLEAAPGPTDAVVSAFKNWLKGIQRDDCSLIHASMRRWSRGDQPFSSQAAVWEDTFVIACKDWGTGTAHPPATSSLSAPLGEVVVLMAKPVFAGTGRTGHAGVRNAVPQEAMLNSAGGPPALNPSTAGTTVTEWNTWNNSQLATYCTDNALPRFCIVHYSKKEGTVFDSAMAVPVFERLSTHDIGKH